jgi:hypothetical protein
MEVIASPNPSAGGALELDKKIVLKAPKGRNIIAPGVARRTK